MRCLLYSRRVVGAGVRPTAVNVATHVKLITIDSDASEVLSSLQGTGLQVESLDRCVASGPWSVVAGLRLGLGVRVCDHD